MGTQGFERKLSAILYADVAGYSRLTGEDEEGTHRRLTAHLAAFTDHIHRHRGRVGHFAGDAVLADFPSLIDALGCAIETQRELGARNAGLPRERRLEFRVGINVGDVLVDRNEVHGESVNIAARLEALAEPGGICISGTAFDGLGNKLPLQCEFMGEQRLRNIDRPVRAYRVVLAEEGTVGTAPPDVAALREGAHTRRTCDAYAERPSIVVLPFRNLGAIPDEDYFCDGLTRDITSELSRFKNLLVIAPHSAFAYKDQPVSPQRIREALGARYLLDGAVRRLGDTVRVDAQLVHTETGHEIWAERQDGKLAELFPLEDEIVRRIVAALAVRVEANERNRVMRKDPADLSAYDLYLKGVHLYSNASEKSLKRSREMFELATKRDPTLARAWGWLSYTHTQIALARWPSSDDVDTARRKAEECARLALSLDPDDYSNHWDMAYVFLNTRRVDEALQAYRRAIERNPNDADLLAEMSETLIYAGEVDAGLKQLGQAMRVNPLHPEWYRWVNAIGLYCAGRYAEAIEALHAIYDVHVDAALVLAASLAQRGETEEARREMQRFLEDKPDWTVADEARRMPFKHAEALSHWLDGLRAAGLPEGEKSPNH